MLAPTIRVPSPHGGTVLKKGKAVPIPIQAPERKKEVELYDVDERIPENDLELAMLVARRENFWEMCKTSLWGSEDHIEFKEFLLSLIVEYLPTSRQSLELLSLVADQQWKLRRVRKLQANVFAAGSASGANAFGGGMPGVPSKTGNAMLLEKDIQKLMRGLHSAIKAYRAHSK